MSKFFRIGIALTLLLSLLVVPALAHPNDPPAAEAAQLPFASNEELVYVGEFSRLLLRGVNIADLTFRVSTPVNATVPNPTPQIRFTAEAVSKGIVTKIFGLQFRQRIDSTVALEPFATKLTAKLDEQGKRVRISESVFDLVEGKVTYTERDPNEPNQPPRVVASPVLGAAQDIASVFYYLRTQELKPGTDLTVQISDSGQVYSVPVKISAGKKMKTVVGKVNTIKVEPDMFGEGKLIRRNGSLVVWMTDDRRHIPVKAQIKADIGTVDITLKRATLARPETPRR
jgi:hypothetical protein